MTESSGDDTMYPLGRQLQPEDTIGTPEHADVRAAHRQVAVRDALRWLTFRHLPEDLQVYAEPFYVAGMNLARLADDSPELIRALNDLVGAQEWAVRAGLRTKTGRAGSVPRPQDVVDPPLLTRDSEAVHIRGDYGPGQPSPRPIVDRPQA